MQSINIVKKVILSIFMFLQANKSFSMEQENNFYDNQFSPKIVSKETKTSLEAEDYTVKTLTLKGKVNSEFSKKIFLFKNLEKLDLRDTDISSLDGINVLTNLKAVNLSGCRIFDSGLKNLPETLEFLDVSDTLVGGAFLKNLPPNSRLKYISLKGTQITSYKILEPLINLPYLQKIDLTNTYVSSQEKDKVKRKSEKINSNIEIILLK